MTGMFNNSVNTRKQGDIGVAAAILHFTEIGWHVSKPLADSQRYDLIVDDGQKLYRVECKTTSHTNSTGNVFRVAIATSGGNQSWDGKRKNLSAKDSDLLFVATMQGTWYLFPTSRFDDKATISLGEKQNEFIVKGNPVQYLPSHKEPAKPKAPSKPKIVWPTAEEVVVSLRTSNYSAYAKQMGVSDNAVRKYITREGYDTKTLNKI